MLLAGVRLDHKECIFKFCYYFRAFGAMTAVFAYFHQHLEPILRGKMKKVKYIFISI